MSAPWSLQARLCDLSTPWFRLIGERFQPPEGEAVDYWRVERAASVIVVPRQGDRLLLPPPQYRPGAKTATWDFPGGRWSPDRSLEAASYQILARELQVSAEGVLRLQPLNPEGWWINSSFSDQKLYGVYALLDPAYPVPPAAIGASYKLWSTLTTPTPGMLTDLDAQLACLQCRAVLTQVLTMLGAEVSTA